MGKDIRLIDALGHRVTILATMERVNMHNYKSILNQTGLTQKEIERYL